MVAAAAATAVVVVVAAAVAVVVCLFVCLVVWLLLSFQQDVHRPRFASFCFMRWLDHQRQCFHEIYVASSSCERFVPPDKNCLCPTTNHRFDGLDVPMTMI